MHLLHTDDAWIKHKLDFNFSKFGPWVAGGAALQWYRNRPTHDDIDLFFRNKEQFEIFSMDLEKKLRGRPPVNPTDITFLEPPYDYPFDKHETDNAITYEIRESITGNELGKIQLIKRKFYDNPLECIADFDISVSQIATDGNRYWFGEHTLADIAAKQFRFTKNLSSSSARRFVKYHAYGFTAVDSAFDELFSSDRVDWVRSNITDDYA